MTRVTVETVEYERSRRIGVEAYGSVVDDWVRCHGCDTPYAVGEVMVWIGLECETSLCMPCVSFMHDLMRKELRS